MQESRLSLTTTLEFNEIDEQQLIQAAQNDSRAFGELYKLYVKRVFGYLFSKTRNVHEAEDLTAQTFITAYESIQKFRNKGHFAAWLFAIARNKTTDHYRKQKNQLASIKQAEEIPVSEDPLQEVILSEQSEALSKLIHNLSEEEQELLRLRFLAEMSFRDIARFVGKNEPAVKKRIYRLLASLQIQLEEANE